MAHAPKTFPLLAETVYPLTKAQPGGPEPHAPEGSRKRGPRRYPHQRQLPPPPGRRRGPAPLAMHEGVTTHKHTRADTPSHAEAFYFQKQIQAQTSMVFVLEDGEEIEGVVEWFDRDTIKVRHTTRTLIFKRSIKYLYKAGGDTHS